jgi:pyrimidine deaminase RibD-like protein
MNKIPSFAYNEERVMKYAMALARKGYPGVFPNPPVGAVLTRNGRIIKTAFHRKAGELHAERMVLDGISRHDSQNVTLHVTLEPCNHFGATAPCTEAILDSGITQVVYGTGDPNPVASGGASFLASKGIDVKRSEISSQCRSFLNPWLRWISSKFKTLEVFVVLSLNGLMYGRRIQDLAGSEDTTSFTLDIKLFKKVLEKKIQLEVYSLEQIAISDAYHLGFNAHTPVDILKVFKQYESVRFHTLRLPLFADISENWQTWSIPDVLKLDQVTRLRDSVYERYVTNYKVS